MTLPTDVGRLYCWRGVKRDARQAWARVFPLCVLRLRAAVRVDKEVDKEQER
jgi:hypothetical protein